MVKCEYYYPDVQDPKDIYDAIYDRRLEWDNGIAECEEVKKFTTKHTSVHRLLHKSILNTTQRDFIDKKFIFTKGEAKIKDGTDHASDDDDDIYLWVTSAPDEVYPVDANSCRATSLFGIIRIGRVKNWPHATRHFQKHDMDPSSGCYLHIMS